ncbi:alpha/beta hydrolase fold domain-containing protein [Caulobacter segnis]
MTSIQSGLTFAVHDGVALKGDLYLPADAGPHPIVVAVPGGAWLRGDKKQLGHWGRHLSAAGFAVFAIDYRRATAGKVFPQNVQDVIAAARFVVDQASALSLDPARLGLLGASAGAHLAALTALTHDQAVTFKTLVGVYGVYDLVAHWQADLDKNPEPGQDHTVRMLGATPYDDQQLYFDASPIRQVNYARNALKTLLVWGTDDADVLPAQSESFARALRQARFFVRTQAVPGAGHFWFSDEPIDGPHSHTGKVAPPLVAFLKQHLA